MPAVQLKTTFGFIFERFGLNLDQRKCVRDYVCDWLELSRKCGTISGQWPYLGMNTDDFKASHIIIGTPNELPVWEIASGPEKAERGKTFENPYGYLSNCISFDVSNYARSHPQH